MNKRTRVVTQRTLNNHPAGNKSARTYRTPIVFRARNFAIRLRTSPAIRSANTTDDDFRATGPLYLEYLTDVFGLSVTEDASV